MKHDWKLASALTAALVFVLAGCGPQAGVLDVGVVNEAESEPTDVVEEELQPIIDAMLYRGYVQRRDLVQFLTTPCTTAEGLGGPPKCAEGETEGTMVDVLPVGGSEGSFVRPEDIDRALDFGVKGFYAAYRVSETAYREAYWPAGEYALVFDREENDYPFPVTVLVEDGKIVRINYDMGMSPADILAAVPVEDIVIPPSAQE